MVDTVSISELSINVVKSDQPKTLTGWITVGRGYPWNPLMGNTDRRRTERT